MPPPQLLGKHVAPALVLAVGHEPGGRGSGGLVPRPMCFEVEMLVGGPEVDFSNCDIVLMAVGSLVITDS